MKNTFFHTQVRRFSNRKWLLTGVAAATLLAAPLSIHAVAQEGPQQRREQITEQLDLSEAQQDELKSIREDKREEIRAILTPQQVAQIENADNPRRAMRSLDLSESQREQIRSIHESSREEMRAVLTPEQQAEWDSLREEYGQRRRGRQR